MLLYLRLFLKRNAEFISYNMNLYNIYIAINEIVTNNQNSKIFYNIQKVWLIYIYISLNRKFKMI